MLRSMTGYGGSERTDGDRVIRVDVRSVNQRFLDVQIKAPRILLSVEDRMRKAVEARLARGRVTVFVDWRGGGASSVSLNVPAARALVAELRELGRELSLPGDLDLKTLASFPQIFESSEAGDGADELWAFVEPAVSQALDDIVAMREAEGRELESELRARLDSISGIVSTVEDAAPRITEELRDKVITRVQELMDGVAPLDETRLVQEAAIAAERSDFTEEVVRLRSHETQASECFDSDEPMGKRLNFLVQEMHREANTIGSKTADTDVSSAVILLKEEIEKFREQVQNVE